MGHILNEIVEKLRGAKRRAENGQSPSESFLRYSFQILAARRSFAKAYDNIGRWGVTGEPHEDGSSKLTYTKTFDS